uniref:Uncharacterized protein n=1 Tax=Avena sativa TaxID=4498 RepID=A0ACD5TPZ4_AVESA
MNRAQQGYSMINDELQEHRIPASRQRCPSCGHALECMPDMAGLPAGVKFDPTDQELIEHLELKVTEGGSKAHPLIDDFIPTIQGEDGICYTHPEKLPGVTKNGQSKHFFHRPSKAYTTGTRKRRKIQAERDLPNSINGAETRWHKTGKTRPLMVDGRTKGCKKILVLYMNFGKPRKPEKTNWVMHQYHLGDLEDEKEGELIVSKVFYQTQPRQSVAATAVVAQDERERDSDMEVETPGSMQIGLTAYALAAAAAVQMQRQLPKQDDEVSAGHQVIGDHEREQQDYHHMPSQSQIVSPNVQGEAVHGMYSLTGKTTSLVTTVASPAIPHASVVLDSQIKSPAVLVRNEKFQMNNEKEGREKQHHNFEHRRSGLDGLIMACQSASTKEGTSATQPEETQWPYQYWPPDNQDHHG